MRRLCLIAILLVGLFATAAYGQGWELPGGGGGNGAPGYVVQSSCAAFTTSGQFCLDASGVEWYYNGSALVRVVPAYMTETLFSGSVNASGAFNLSGNLSGTPQAITFAAQNPVLQITSAGSLPYLITYWVRPSTTGATYSGPNDVQCYLYRTNNTPAILANSTFTSVIPIMTTATMELGSITGTLLYTSAGTNDSITIYCSVGSTPAAGSVGCVSGGAYIQATGLFY